ncbi:SRS domain-containing protein [Neospora caninum Liverpool]|uniref:SRS domain-containing protein n=1 Tax=Neospora caninum (strain Liverpool) TaxID=572307 RepID=F0VNT8_NEOCL|nr:SRS domain-containing protein [Neospora caninum Liverpool]CBZ55384.1 SRS domain-containing protein [Neospora caninum Liverpool]CEL70120.1 TPA: SRS domain-containing protein [Neospora caninum Liverpool]|eukprot:XP_003885412.1 SRS domain-containing protein [Neospora caninum Liverpool]
MMAPLLLVVTVLMSTTVLGTKEDAGTTNKLTCDAGTNLAGISVEVDADTKRASFVCGTHFSQVLPSSEGGQPVTKCYMTGEAVGQDKNEKSLVELFGNGSEATVNTPSEQDQQGSEVTLSLGKLPQRTTTIYFGCKAATNNEGGTGPGSTGVPGVGALAAAKAVEKKCVVTVTVPADPAANTCTVAKQNMDLEITSESKSVSFQCDTIIDRLNPENHSDLIFDESCQNPVRLADMLPSAKLATSTSGYTFSVEELPETAGTFCYKCAAASGSEQEGEELRQEPNACYVKIQVPQRSNAASTSAFARSVQALLLGLGVFVAFVQVMY